MHPSCRTVCDWPDLLQYRQKHDAGDPALVDSHLLDVAKVSGHVHRGGSGVIVPVKAPLLFLEIVQDLLVQRARVISTRSVYKDVPLVEQCTILCGRSPRAIPLHMEIGSWHILCHWSTGDHDCPRCPVSNPW